MITEIDASLLEKIADLTGKPVGVPTPSASATALETAKKNL